MVHDLKEQHTDAVNTVVFVYNFAKQKWYAWAGSYDQSISVWVLPEAPAPPENIVEIDLASLNSPSINDYGAIPTGVNNATISILSNTPSQPPVRTQPPLANKPHLQQIPRRSTLTSPQAPTNLQQLNQKLWLYGNLDRASAENLLISGGNGNYFLIRASSVPNCYALSKCSNFQVWHLVIQPASEGYVIQDSNDKAAYPSLDLLVQETPELKGFLPIGSILTQ